MNKPSSSDAGFISRHSGFLILLGLLLVVLSVLFYRSFLPNEAVFSNDGPLGETKATSVNPHLGVANTYNQLGGLWQDLNWLGNEGIKWSPSITTLIGIVLGPYAYARFAAPLSLLILGLCAWFFFRQLRLAPIACVIGGLATALNSDFFSTACWGITPLPIAIGANYLALAALARVAEGSPRRSWIRVVLAGMAVGMGVMQGWDVAALFSLFVAAYVLYQALFMNDTSAGVARNFSRGIGRVVIVAAFAAIIATDTLVTLIGTQIVGVTGMAQDEATREARFVQATQWSLPKSEILQVMVPGLFGYRNYWHMYDDNQPKDDQYWGLIGEDGHGFWRLSGTGLYAGVFAVMVALWASLQSLRKSGSPFSTDQRRALWFWSGVLIVTTLLAFGKYLPFLYRLFYALPYASTIRNPTKFMHVFSWALMIVFAYGVHGLYVAYMENPVRRVGGFLAQLKSWWASAATFEQVWLAGSIFAIALSLVAWVIYSGKYDDLVKYISTVGIPAEQAAGVAHFSIASMGWFILFLVLAIGVLVSVFIGRFSGPRAKWGGVLIGALLLADLGRANVPWIDYWDTAYKYKSDPIVSFLADNPYEHRVGLLPWASKGDQDFYVLNAMYGTAWKQHLFWYNDVQCVDIVQEPRVGQDKIDFVQALGNNPLRIWELTSTRYLLGEAGVVTYLNQQLDPQKQRFKLAQFPNGQPVKFNLALKSGAPPIDPATFDPLSRSADFITTLDSNGEFGVIEFTGALPRASLIPTWQINTNNADTLQILASPAFDPHQTVLVADSIPAPPPPGPNPGTGTVHITKYEPRRIELAADVNAPTVLLMTDRYSLDNKWKVTVDGKPDRILRCNFVERGVYLEPGKHEVVFSFIPDRRTFWFSLGAVIFGLFLCGWLAVKKDSEPTGSDHSPRPANAPTTPPESDSKSPKKKTRKV